MRLASAVLAALVAAATPAAARYCNCGGGAFTEPGPVDGHYPVRVHPAPGGAYTEFGAAYLVVPRTSFIPHTHYVMETHRVARPAHASRTRLVRRTVEVPRTEYEVNTTYSTYAAGPAYPGPAYVGAGYPAGYRYGGTYQPPLFNHPCTTGSIGCDSSAVGPLYDY